MPSLYQGHVWRSWDPESTGSCPEQGLLIGTGLGLPLSAEKAGISYWASLNRPGPKGASTGETDSEEAERGGAGEREMGEMQTGLG